ncbi:hypothetical protein C8R46DRAFT_1067066, partial [Mycena filopes]
RASAKTWWPWITSGLTAWWHTAPLQAEIPHESETPPGLGKKRGAGTGRVESGNDCPTQCIELASFLFCPRWVACSC